MKYRYPLLLAIIAVTVPLIGNQFSSIAADGTLNEPFFFTVPLMYLALLVALIWVGVITWRRHHHSH